MVVELTLGLWKAAIFPSIQLKGYDLRSSGAGLHSLKQGTIFTNVGTGVLSWSQNG